jgi:hypothetical protein
VAGLSVGERQRVEILKALYRDARILILDEPTAVLARPEAQRLFETLRGMTGQGLSIIFISHKLNEVMAASDRVAVLRGGRKVAERKTAETSPEELAELMVGRRVTRPKREAHAIGAPRSGGRGRDRASGWQAHAGGRVLHGACRAKSLGSLAFPATGRRRWGRFCRVLRRRAGRLTLESARSVGSAPAPSLPKGSAASPRIAMPRAWWASCRSGKTACWSGWQRPSFATRGFVRRAAARDHAAG